MTLTEAACGTPRSPPASPGMPARSARARAGCSPRAPRSLGDAMADVLTDDDLRARLSEGALAAPPS